MVSKVLEVKNDLNILGLTLFGFLYLVASILVPTNYQFLFVFLFAGYIALYAISPTISFVYAFIFIIDPLDNFQLSGQLVIPFVFCLYFIFSNIKEIILLIKNDRKFVKLIQVCLVFTLYQLLVSLMIKQGQDLYYILINIDYWFGIWILIPAYVFTLYDRKNLFAAIIVLVFICMTLYFLTFFKIYEFFKIQATGRSEDNLDLERVFAFDLRFVTKFFVYLLPLFIFFPLKNLKLKYCVILIGILVSVAVLLALLRTEMFYLFIGALISFGLSYFKFKKTSLLNASFSIVIGAIIIVKLFPGLLDSVLETIEITIGSKYGIEADETLSHRLLYQIPIATEIFNENFLLGGGLYSVSPDATGGHYILFDVPYIAAFSAYGVLGMFIYYLRFIFIISRYRLVKFSQKLYDSYPVECLVVNSLMAYFITMVFFKLIHSNVELAFNFGMTETGLFIGAFFGLTRFLFEQNNILNIKK